MEYFVQGFIVDVQGFRTALNEFTFKEVAVTRIGQDAIPSVYIFKPPYNWDELLPKNQSENRWLEYNYHDIPCRLADARRIYVKGLEKKRWLETYIDNVINIEDFNCPAFKDLRLGTVVIFCTHHYLCATPICAAMNVSLLKDWALENLSQKKKKVGIMIDEVLNAMYT
ncbi:hypothetical protein QAD02_007871 [Eretmocerus hayati]|uniref:Uncharacterized protein n=1 Tax=Eretmocerus hayati TaxID=131215 RepID=A0ACC2N577_9HYME|nr:hypothetical protein QAD02_007871 [Eretmocerus hayati]